MREYIIKFNMLCGLEMTLKFCEYHFFRFVSEMGMLEENEKSKKQSWIEKLRICENIQSIACASYEK